MSIPITAAQVKVLREKTNVSMAVCKKALEATEGDIGRAIEYMRIQGELKAADISTRTADQGSVTSYIHPGSQVGVMLRVSCESDFVARSAEFNTFCKDVAMHIAASKPMFTSLSEAQSSMEAAEERYRIAQAVGQDPKMAKKTEEMRANIIAGKVDKALKAITLEEQPFVKDTNKTIGQLRKELIMQLGENITIAEFVRMSVGGK